MKENTSINYFGYQIYHNGFAEFNICQIDSDSMLTPTSEYSFKSLNEAKKKIKEMNNIAQEAVDGLRSMK